MDGQAILTTGNTGIMSSYLNIYLIEKDCLERKPKKLVSYSRNNEVYQFFRNNLELNYSDNPTYTTITTTDLEKILNDVKATIKRNTETQEWQASLEKETNDIIQEAIARILKAGVTKREMDELYHSVSNFVENQHQFDKDHDEYLESLNDCIGIVNTLLNIQNTMEVSGVFNEMCCNIT